ncbi:hypothetical protein M406DRAFT_101014 [Cryphonectria parasitica EP155]|uniref:Glucose-repressible protein n=1 Tax=Cryphonectria parasitica (strain ATCC 38755 / EP155) TaxID=660469 RepID=A0A9P4YCB3_CRYP1|nr:uncharacterized protein M406DRAFT_101014 [Cryphonectria parasitica EP155]KAF3770857.1 hypothetical protein M406DRAFT_101014 [Cryphonectria parasitica EP155]
MDTIKNTANYVSDKASELTNSASKETNKQVAKDSDVSITDRAKAGKDYVGDSLDEHKDKASAETNKQKATH